MKDECAMRMPIAEDEAVNRSLHEKLRESQEGFRELADHAKKVAHDLNNLLTVVQGRAGLMLEQLESHPLLKESAQEICAAAQRAAVLCCQLLNPNRPEPMPLTDEPTACGQGEAILLVEDEEPLRSLTRTVLQGRGYEVFDAATGVAALEQWKRRSAKFDLLLTDMVLADGMSGRDLAEKLCAERPALRLVFSSGYRDGVVGRNLALKEGVNFLQKPYDIPTLVHAVRCALDSRPADFNLSPLLCQTVGMVDGMAV